jgi:hypothetical protein
MLNLIFKTEKEYENFLMKFYEYVIDKRDIKHFFFCISFEKLLKDQILYYPLIIKKPFRYYKENVMQTAPSAIQVKVPQFDEILFVLKMLLEKDEYPKSLISIVAVNIIEIAEETRAQLADAEVKIWKPFEINKELINDFYNKNKTDSRIEKNDDVYISNGLLVPIWTRVLKDKSSIIFIAQIFSASMSTTIETFNEFKDELNHKFDYIRYQTRESKTGPVLYSRHEISYTSGLPSRMFMRAVRTFASIFESGFRLDLNGLLKIKKS